MSDAVVVVSGTGADDYDTIYSRRGQAMYSITPGGKWGVWCNSSGPLSTNDDLRGGPHVILCQSYDSIGALQGTVRLFTNGVQHGVTGAGAVSTSGTRDVGADQGSGRYFKGWIAEILDYDRQLSDADRIRVENYLKAKQGCKLSPFHEMRRCMPHRPRFLFIPEQT